MLNRACVLKFTVSFHPLSLLRRSQEKFIPSIFVGNRRPPRNRRVRVVPSRRPHALSALRRPPGARRQRRERRRVQIRTRILGERNHPGRPRRSARIAHRTHPRTRRAVDDGSRARQPNRIRRPPTPRDDSIPNPVFLSLLPNALRREASRQRRLTRRTLLNVMRSTLHDATLVKDVSTRQTGDELNLIRVIARLGSASIQRRVTHRAVALPKRVPGRLTRRRPTGRRTRRHRRASRSTKSRSRREIHRVSYRIRQPFRIIVTRRRASRSRRFVPLIRHHHL
jgi:hypothetical protein